jgi:hypothetical protein
MRANKRWSLCWLKVRWPDLLFSRPVLITLQLILGGLVNPIDERDDLVKILMDSNYAENWHDVIELCLQHVTDLRYKIILSHT